MMIGRSYKAAAIVSSFSALLLLLLALSIQFSSISPLHSIYECYLVAKRSLIYSSFEILLVFAETVLLSNWIFSVKYEANLNIAKAENWIAFAIIFARNILSTLVLSFALLKTPIWFSSGSTIFLWIISTFLFSVVIAYTTSFRLYFPDKVFTFAGLRHHFIPSFAATVLEFAIFSLKLFGISWLIMLNFAIFLRPLHSSLTSLFAFWRFFDLLLLLFVQNILLRLLPPIVNNFLMQPIEFPLPSIYYAATESLNTAALTLVQAIESKEPLIKMFGLRQLHRICTGSTVERQPLYTLSQPGGHPRNWIALRDVALELVRQQRDRLHFETHYRTIQSTSTPQWRKGHLSQTGFAPLADRSNGSAGDSLLADNSLNNSSMLNELYQGKQSFFVPPALNPRKTENLMLERNDANRLIRFPTFVDSIMDRLRACLFVPPPIIPTYDMTCTIYAIEALSSVISHSLAEDEFGVLQKDLKQCLSALARLSIGIDAYVRASGLTTSRSKLSADWNIFNLDENLAHALAQIRDSFGHHLRELDIHSVELEVFLVVN